jgi:hypothetical protein
MMPLDERRASGAATMQIIRITVAPARCSRSSAATAPRSPASDRSSALKLA